MACLLAKSFRLSLRLNGPVKISRKGIQMLGLRLIGGVEPVKRVFRRREGDAATRIKLTLNLALSGLPLFGPEVGL
jgi:hypothetical protein